MHELARCLIETTVVIGGHRYRVRIPRTREAIILYAALEAYRSGEAGAEAIIRRVCRAWLPARLFDHYFGRQSLLAATLSDLGALLKVGVADLQQHARDRRAVEEAARQRSMFANC